MQKHITLIFLSITLVCTVSLRAQQVDSTKINRTEKQISKGTSREKRLEHRMDRKQKTLKRENRKLSREERKENKRRKKLDKEIKKD